MAHESIFLGVTDAVKKLGIRVQPQCSILTLVASCMQPASFRKTSIFFWREAPGYAGEWFKLFLFCWTPESLFPS